MCGSTVATVSMTELLSDLIISMLELPQASCYTFPALLHVLSNSEALIGISAASNLHTKYHVSCVHPSCSS